MVEGWTCGRCGTANIEASLVCAACGTTRPDDIADVAPVPTPPAPEAVVPWPPPGASEGVMGESSSPATAPLGVEGWRAPDTVAPPPDGIVGWQAPGVDAGAPAAPKPIWRRLPIGWLVVGVFVVGAAVAGWYFNAGRSASGEIDRSGDLMATELRIGDCFDLKDPSADEVEDVTATPCSVAHEYEVIFVGSLAEGDYPAEAAFDSWVQANCQPAFDAYVGTAYADSELDIFWFYPTDDAWRSGDRSVQCAAYHPRIHRLTDSLKGSNQ